MGEGIEGLLALLGKGIIGLTTGKNATGSPEEQQMVQGILSGGSPQAQQANPHVNEPIPSAINVMRRTPEEQSNLGLGGVTPQESKIQNQMLQYGAGNVNQFREQPLSSLNVSEQARSEIASFLPQMSVDQQEAFLQGVRDGKVSEYELENQRRLRQGY